MSASPPVTVAVPVLDEEHHIEACLGAIAAQTNANIVEVLVIDGGSTDRTREIALRLGATVLDNPRRIQAAALNIGLEEAKGAVLVRVDGHCELAPDYVERCVEALERTGAAMVGGGMTPMASGWKQRGIAAAMSSPLGAGPARFHVGGAPGWVDTVYLGAYRTDDARAAGGYAEDVGVNEDAEFAIRMARSGGVWFDPAIQSTYVPRDSFRALARQFYRYGRSRAATVRKHPRSLHPRQLLAPALLLGLISRYRRPMALAYSVVVVGSALAAAQRENTASSGFAVALPVMHLCWGAGFLVETVAGFLHPRER